MKVLASIHLYLPTHNCGSEAMLHHIFKYLISKGHQCRVALHYAGKYNIKYPYNYEGVEVIVGKDCGRVDTYRWADVVVTHLDMTQFTMIMSHEAKKPLVHFVHNDIPYQSVQQARVRTYIAYNSQWIADSLRYSQPGIVIHPPCNAAAYQVESSREYITLVSLNERKGGYKLIEIARAMPERKFIGVIGSYDNPGALGMGQMEIVNQLMQLPNVTIVPNTPDILSTYRRTGILIMPSDYESWGRTATEAMQSGIPVICTPTPGLKENCGNAGIFVGKEIMAAEPGQACVDTGNVTEWVEAIRALDDPAEYEKYSLLCRKRAAELDPLKELEAFEQFLYKIHGESNNKYRQE